MTVYIKLTIAGADTGPFNLYSDVDVYSSPFEEDVVKAGLIAGYSTAFVPDGTKNILVKSTSALCGSSIIIPIVETTTTTTTV